jgi:hypothetical protein
MTVNFEQYFLKLFPKSLSGALTADFVETVQKYIQILSEAGKLDSTMAIAKYPSQHFTCKSKRSFL